MNDSDVPAAPLDTSPARKKSPMRRTIKGVLRVIITVLVGLIVAVCLFVTFLNQIIQSYKPDLERWASNAAGFPVAARKIRIHFLPQLSLELRGVSLGGPEVCATPGEVEALELAIDPQALWNRRLHIEEIFVRGGTLRLVSADGTVGLLPKDCPTAPAAPAPPQASTPTQPQAQPQAQAQPQDSEQESSNKKWFTVEDGLFTIREVAVRNTLIEGLPQLSGRVLNVQYLRFELQGQTSGESLLLVEPELQLLIDTLPITARAGQLLVNPLQSSVGLSEGRLRVVRNEITISGELRDWYMPQRVRVTTPALDLAELGRLLDIWNMKLPATKGKLQAEIDIGGTLDGPLTASGKIRATQLELRQGLKSLHDLDLKVTDLVVHPTGEISGSVEFNARGINPPAKSSIPKMQTVSGEIKGERSTEKGLSLEGNLTAGEITLADKLGSLKSVTLTKLSVTSGPAQRAKVSTRLAVQGLSLSAGSEQYKVDSLEGPFHFAQRNPAGFSLDGNAHVRNFFFSDSTTTVKDVTAALNKIKVDQSKDGSVVATVLLEGKSVVVQHAEVNVHGAEKVSAPLRVEVPAAGGYSVSGPVAVTRGRVRTIDNEFSEVTGVVDMVVASGRKSFQVDNVHYKVLDTPGSLRTHFEMLSDGYFIKNTVIRLGGGEVQGAFRWGRKDNKTFDATLSAQTLPVPLALKIIPGNTDDDDLQGTLQNFNGSFSGLRENIIGSLKGQGRVELHQGLLKSVRLNDALWEAVRSVPIVGSVLGPQDLEADPNAQELRGIFTVEHEQVNFSKLDLDRRRYAIKGKGKVTFKGELDLEASVILLKESFKALGGGVKSIGNLFGRVGKIELPLFINGTFDNLRITPDIPTFLRNNSGLPIAESIVETVGDVGKGIFGVVTSPFRDGSTDKLQATPSPTATAAGR